MAYISDIKPTTINISIANVIRIEFRICLILSMRLIFIKALIEYIKFSLVKANTFFIFCLIDMD